MKTKTFVLSGLVMALALAPALAVVQDDEGQARRNFDARATFSNNSAAAPGFAQHQAAATWQARIPSLSVTYDRATGATRTVYNRVGYLTEPNQQASAGNVAIDFVHANLDLLGISSADLLGYEVTDNVFVKATGSTHLYLRQRHADLPVYNAQLAVNVNREGRIISVNNAFLPNLASAVNTTTPAISATEALLGAARNLGMTEVPAVQLISSNPGPARATRLSAPTVSNLEVDAQLMWLPIRRGIARLVWNFQVQTLDDRHWFDYNVDAVTGKIWTRFDWAANVGDPDDHRVVPEPAESPNHLPVTPPADGRTIVTDPSDATASPLGWFNDGTTSYTITRGNNTNSYEDTNGSNSPSTPQPDCGVDLDCDFDFMIDFGTQEPSTYQDAAVSNLFYWNNLIHDVQYQYGFDEAGGNFQVDNFGNGGLGGDAVQSEAQDPGNCNANMNTPPDGSTPRMQMFTCTNASPARDGDFDNAVIVHEYGHGISIRQVGGPGNSGCLNNTQQGGEGYSDWWGLAYTIEPGDAGTDSRGIGTYLFGQPIDGPGIRPQPYSTDPLVNSYTYESINGLSIPHGVGSVWAQAYWEVTWALIDEHGFDPDLHNGAGTAGNQRAMLYINQAMKNSVCGPAFTDMRDAVVQAAVDNHGGEDVCLIWETFAEFGLGTDADSGGPNSTSPTNGFELPVECQCAKGQTIPIADAGGDTTVCDGDSVTIGTPALPGHTYLWSPGGETTAQITVSPTDTTIYTVTVTTDCGDKDDSATVFVDPGNGAGIDDDFESGLGDWTTSGLWHLVTDTGCTAPEPGYSSPLNSVYYGQDGPCTYATGATTIGDLISPTLFGIDASSTLTFDHFREVEEFDQSFDITSVDVISGGTATNIFFLDSTTPSGLAWTSSGPISLGAFDGLPIQLRFRFDSGDDQFNDFIGWLIDDVEVTGTDSCSFSSEIFSDGFESGDTSLWSSTSP